MRSRFSKTLALLCISGGAAFALHTHHARAGWPPAPGADMRDPSNWPNDYHERWNYLSYFPKRDISAGPLLPEDAKLGAAGMSIDKAWTYTIGRDDVKIMVIDSGIKWEEPELLNKVALNAVEIVGKDGKGKPQKSDGGACGG